MFYIMQVLPLKTDTPRLNAYCKDINVRTIHTGFLATITVKNSLNLKDYISVHLYSHGVHW